MLDKIRKIKAKMLSVLMAVAMLLTASGVAFQSEPLVMNTVGAGVVGTVLTAVILVLIASALMPVISNSTDDAVTTLDNNGDASSPIVGIWTLGVAVAVLMAIFAFAL